LIVDSRKQLLPADVNAGRLNSDAI
jgi:hypothetical protein